LKKSIEPFIDECNNKYFDSNISLLWNFVQDERKDKEATIFKIIEAKLGFNIDEWPEEEINKIIEKAKYFGEKSTQELSVLLYKESIVEKEIDGLKNHNIGTDIFIENLYEMRKYAKQNENKFLPWEYGYALAHEFRRSYGIESVLSTEQMCKIIGTSKEKLYINSQKNSDFALGVSFSRNQYSVILNKKYSTAIRFMTARMLCDAIIAEADDNVLPATSSKTARQKIQRAFATELLCPIDLIEDRLDNNYTNEDMWSYIAEEFEVTTLLVKSQLANHSLIQQFDNANIWFDPI